MNAEVVHDLRVVIRQLKSMMCFFKPLIRKVHYRQGQTLLSEALHTFETARENAVLLEALEDYEKNNTALDESFKNAISHWKSILHLAHESELQVSQDLTAGYDWRTSMEAWLILMWQTPFKSKKIKGQSKSFAQRRMKLLLLQWLSNYQTLKLEDDAEIHKSRIECKKLRYMLRAMNGTLLPKSPALLRSLEAYQDHAGQLHEISRFKVMMDDLSRPELIHVKGAFLLYEESRAAELRIRLLEVKQRLEQDIIQWIEVGKGQE
jgi:CHAD domain-containing protein